MGFFDFLKSNNGRSAGLTGDPFKDIVTLRNQADKQRNITDSIRSRISACKLGIQMFREGNLIVSAGLPNDAGTLLEDIQYCMDKESITDHESNDFAEAYFDIVTQLGINLSRDEWDDFLTYAEITAELYTRGEDRPRDPQKARLLWQNIFKWATQKGGDSLAYAETSIAGWMEVPDDVKNIAKAICGLYGLELNRVRSGAQVCMPSLYGLFQCFEHFEKMDIAALNSRDPEKVVGEYLRCATADNPYAMYILGCFYLKGNFVRADTERGIHYLEAAAKKDFYMAADKLSNRYLLEDEDAEKGSYWSQCVDRLNTQTNEKCAAYFAAVRKMC